MMSPPNAAWCGLKPPSPVSWAKPPILAPLFSAMIAFELSEPQLMAEMLNTEAE